MVWARSDAKSGHEVVSQQPVKQPDRATASKSVRIGNSAMKFETRHSGIWQLSSTVPLRSATAVSSSIRYFRARAGGACRALPGPWRSARRGIYPWPLGSCDWLVGVPDAPVRTSPVWRTPSVIAPRARASKDLADAQEFDGRWYVERPAALSWLPAHRVEALRDEQMRHVGALTLWSLLLPGHSPDGLALLVRRPDFAGRRTPSIAVRDPVCRRLCRLLRHAGTACCRCSGGPVRQVIPFGHGPVLSAGGGAANRGRGFTLAISTHPNLRHTRRSRTSLGAAAAARRRHPRHGGASSRKLPRGRHPP